MTKRPMCIAAIFWAAILWMLGTAGVPLPGFSQPRLPGGKTEGQGRVSGIVYQMKSYETFQSIYLKKVNLILNSKQYPLENIKVTVKTENLDAEVSVGSLVSTEGWIFQIPLPTNPGQFHERNYYYARKIKWYMEGSKCQLIKEKEEPFLVLQNRIREKIRKGIEGSMPESTRGIFLAMLTGEKEELSQEQKALFQATGGSHILAISGLHLSILGWGFYKILQKFRVPVKAAGILSGIWIFFYGMMTGSSASAMRAAVMFAAAVGALLFKRTYDLLSAMALASILLLAVNPSALYDSSFLLSFGALAGLGIVLPVLFKQQKKRRFDWVLQGLKSGISVWIATLPLVLYFFYEVPVWGILLNLAVLPAISVILISGIAGCLLGMLPGGAAVLGKLAAVPGGILLTGYLKTGELVEMLPVFLWVTGQPEIWKCVLYYLVLLAVLAGRSYGAEHLPWLRKRKGDLLEGVLLTAGILFLTIRVPEYQIRTVFLDVGQGDCACIFTKTGGCYLVDGGSSSQSSVGRYRILPFLKSQGVGKIDGIFVSHGDQDHINGIYELLEMRKNRESPIKIQYLFLSECEETKEELAKLAACAGEAGCRTVFIRQGTEIKEGDLKIRCLSPKSSKMGSNEGSQVLDVSCGEFDILFTGDVEKKGEEEVTGKIQGMDKDWELLKVAHHGSGNSTSQEFLHRLSPGLGIISCGEKNPYGHPDPELLLRFQEEGIPAVQTWQTGAVTAIWNGKETKISFHRREFMIE